MTTSYVPTQQRIPTTAPTGQLKIAVTGTPVQFPSNIPVGSIIIKASSNNSDVVFIGGSSVTTANDGTGTGFPIDQGQPLPFLLINLNGLYLNGNAGDWVSYIVL